MGKSTLAYYVSKRCDTRVYWDPRFQFRMTPHPMHDSSELPEALDTQEEIVVQPGRGLNKREAFEDFCRVIADWVQENPHETICMVVDEAQLTGLDSKTVNEDFDWLLRSAREGANIFIVMTAHRPADISTNIRAIANRIVWYRVTLPNDIEAVEWQCGPEIAQQVKSLLDKEYIVWNNSRQQWKRVSDPKTWYIEISERQLVS